jgi:predicted transcriptional regulator
MRNTVCTINFQADKKLHDDLHAAAREQERSASWVIRSAVRAWLERERQQALSSPHPATAPETSPV